MTKTSVSVADFVVKVANPYFPVNNDMLQPSENLLLSAMEYAVQKKVFPLFYDGCLNNQIRLPKDAEALISEYRRRRHAQIKAAKLLVDIQEKHSIHLMFFKTFRPFNYIPDDVDVLVRNEDDYSTLVGALKHEGYYVLKVGTPEVGFRKTEEGTYVDLDIHKRLAVGSLDLFEVESLWRKHAFETLELGDGYKASKFSEDYEVVREAAYSLLKDFKVSVSGLYLGINALQNRNINVIEKIAIEENFVPHLHVYIGVIRFLAERLYGSKAKLTQAEAKDSSIILNLCRNLRTPYPYPVTVITWAYLSRALLEIQRKKNVKVLLQIAKQPSSKGMDILFDYIRESIP